jgi:hypothetical protein
MGEDGAIPAHQVFHGLARKNHLASIVLKTGGSNLENSLTIGVPPYCQVDLSSARPHF